MLDQQGQSVYKILTVITYSFLVIAPAIYLGLAYFMLKEPLEHLPDNEMMKYMLLAVSVVTPALFYPIKRFQKAAFRKNPNMGGGPPKMSLSPGKPVVASGPAGFAMTINIVSMATIEAVYVFGFMTYIMTYEIDTMLLFYVIGIAWSVFRWPTRSRFEKLVEELSAYGKTG